MPEQQNTNRTTAQTPHPLRTNLRRWN